MQDVSKLITVKHHGVEHIRIHTLIQERVQDIHGQPKCVINVEVVLVKVQHNQQEDAEQGNAYMDVLKQLTEQ